MAQKKYVDLAGLGEFLVKLKAGYEANDAANFKVNYAATAGAATKATQDVNGDVINTTYLKVAAAAETYVPLTRKIADVALDNDITKAAMLTALNVEDGAQVNLVESIAVKDEAIVSHDGTAWTIDLDGYAKKSDITAVLKFKGVKATEAEIKAIENPSVGDVYLCQADESEYVCVAVAGGVGTWEKFGTMSALTNYYTKGEVDNLFATERGVREAAEEALDGKITAEAERAAAAEEEIAGDLAEEISNREAAIAQEVLDRDAAITAAVEALDVTDITAPYFTAIGETDGKIHATAGVKGAIADGDTRLVDGDTVYDYVESKTYDDHTYSFASAASGQEGQFTYEEFLNGEKVGETHTITVNADVNVLEGVKVNGTALQIAAADKTVDIDMSAYTDQTLVAGSAEPASSAAVLAAGFAYDADIIALTNAEIDTLFA